MVCRCRPSPGQAPPVTLNRWPLPAPVSGRTPTPFRSPDRRNRVTRIPERRRLAPLLPFHSVRSMPERAIGGSSTPSRRRSPRSGSRHWRRANAPRKMAGTKQLFLAVAIHFRWSHCYQPMRHIKHYIRLSPFLFDISKYHFEYM